MFDDMSLMSRVRAFDLKHSQDHPPVTATSQVFFADGAVRDADPMGPLIDPPKEQHELARNIFHYWELRLKTAREKFHEFRQLLLSTVKSNLNSGRPIFPPSENQVVAQLKELQADVLAIKAEWEKAKQFKEENPDPRVVVRQQNIELARQQNESLASAIQAITI